MEVVAVYNPEYEEVTIFAVNRNIEHDVNSLRAAGFKNYEVLEYIVMENDDMKAVNNISSQNVKPESKTEYSFDDGLFTTDMKKCSWNVIRLGLKK